MADSVVAQDLSKGLTFFQKHERIIIVALVLAFGTFAVNKIENVIASRDAQNAVVLAGQVQTDKQAATKAAQDAATAMANLQTALNTLQAQNASLSAAVARDEAMLKDNQAKDATLALPQLAERWAQLAQVPVQSFNMTPTGVLAVDSGAAHATVSMLEEVPSLQDQLTSQTKIAQNNANLLTQSQGVSAKLQTDILALQTTQADSDKKCQADMKVLKDDAAKAKKKYFIIGTIVGVIIRSALHL